MELNTDYNDAKLETRALCVILRFRQVFFKKLHSKLNLPLRKRNEN